jgi:hypothetical protein
MPYVSTKRGKPVKRSRWPGAGLRWFGRDDGGVSIWDGKTYGLKYGGWLLRAVGIGSIVASPVLLTLGMTEAASIVGGVGLLHTGLSVWMLRLRDRIESMVPAESVAERLHMTPDEVDRFREQTGVKPRVIMNGQPMFDPSDFGDPARLLRAAGAPQNDELLRPAGTTTSDSSLLVRPANDVEETVEPSATAEMLENPLTLDQRSL